MTLFFALLAAGAQVASPMATPAVPQNADDPQGTIVISTKDLDLTGADDRKRLDQRIAGAASKICHNLSATSTSSEEAECTSRAIQNARGRREALIASAFYVRSRELNGGGALNGITGLEAGGASRLK